MSLYAMVFFATMPIGSLLIGWLAQGIGEPPAVIINAVLALVVAALVWMFIPRMRALA
jgi:MFS family permease